jgi:hypothetical protein
MSGYLGATFPQPMQLGTLPPEGSRSVAVGIPWLPATGNPFGPLTSSYSYGINLLPQYQSGKFTTVQAVWIDNSTCPYSVQLTCAESAQSIIAPAFSQGIYPLVVQQAPSFVATLLPLNLGSGAVLACTTTLIFMNVPAPTYQQEQPSIGGQTASISVPFNGSSSVVLPAPSGAKQHYLINSFQIFSQNGSVFPFPGSLGVLLAETGNQAFFEDAVLVNGTQTGPYYTKTVNYTSPVFLPFQKSLTLTFGQSATLSSWIGIQYGLVTVQ